MMSFQLFSPSPFLCTLGLLILVLLNIQLSLSNPDILNCRSRFKCGSITAGYPFWGGEGGPYSRPEFCGHKDLLLCCENDTTIMWIKGVEYRVLNINEQAQVLKIGRQDYLSGNCPPDEYVSTTIDSTLFEYSPGYENFTLRYSVPPGQRTCSIEEMKNFNYKDGLISTINLAGLPTFNVTVPVLESYLQEAQESLSGLVEALKKGFEVKWKVNGMEFCYTCTQSSGSCGYANDFGNQTTCYCPHPPFLHFQHQGACSTLPIGQPPKGLPDTPGKYINF